MDGTIAKGVSKVSYSIRSLRDKIRAKLLSQSNIENRASKTVMTRDCGLLVIGKLELFPLSYLE